MKEYKLPKERQWQTQGDPILKHGPLSGTTAPDFIPAAVGVVYVNTAALVIYISTGTSSISDWRQVWAD
jgi:hypothetical protein